MSVELRADPDGREEEAKTGNQEDETDETVGVNQEHAKVDNVNEMD